MEVNDLQSGRDLNFRVELTNIDLFAKFYIPSFTRDFSVPKLNFACKPSLNAPPPFHIEFEKWPSFKRKGLSSTILQKYTSTCGVVVKHARILFFGYWWLCTFVWFREIMISTGEEVEVRNYKRLTELKLEVSWGIYLQWRIAGGGEGANATPELLRGGHCPPLSICPLFPSWEGG